jgi:DNA-binding NarL/FixJ family response regulator
MLPSSVNYEPMQIKVAIADDHPMIIKGLQNMLATYPHIHLIDTYLNGSLLMEGLTKQIPDVLLLDIQLPGKTGDELAPVILKKYPAVRILTLTNFDSTLHASNMLRQGVHGFLIKNADETVLIEAIETVYRGETFLEDSMKEKLHDLNIRITKAVSSKSMLTPREKEILQLIVDGLTSQEIAEKLFLSQNTVENSRASIMLKMDVKNVAVLIKKALRNGLAH